MSAITLQTLIDTARQCAKLPGFDRVVYVPPDIYDQLSELEELPPWVFRSDFTGPLAVFNKPTEDIDMANPRRVARQGESGRAPAPVEVVSREDDPNDHVPFGDEDDVAATPAAPASAPVRSVYPGTGAAKVAVEGGAFVAPIIVEKIVTEVALGNIFERIAAVMKEVDYIQKREPTDNLKYWTLAHADVLKKVRPAIIRAGLVVLPGDVKEMHYRQVKTRNAEWTVVDIVQEFKICSTDGSSILTTSGGSGADSMDKSLSKAITMASKNALVKLFMIESGEDHPDDRDQEDGAAPAAGELVYITSEHLNEVIRLAKDARLNHELLCESYGIQQIADLTEEEFPGVVQRLQDRIKKIAAGQ